jgi:aerobic-type carbon monoxide dehydrogenase small subunit (CoxS/CutS family)
MIDNVTIVVDGVPHPVAADTTLAAALLNLGIAAFRRDLTSNARGPLCGMGTCFECRVMVDGVANVRSCLEMVRDGMVVQSAT